MQQQQDLFQLGETRYINCAYMAPLLKSAEEKGIAGLIRKRNPKDIVQQDYFSEVAEVREKFASLIQAKASQIALMPSVSYGFSSVLNNIHGAAGQEVLVIEDEFPSGYFSALSWCRKNGATLKTIQRPTALEKRGQTWNEQLVAAIGSKTAFVLISSVHWMDGMNFDLKAIGEACRKNGAKLLVDGTQSVGAQAFKLNETPVDALFCAGYKWLLGPYSHALAYISNDFNEGTPLEETWMNRTNAQNFAQLAHYDDQYTADAGRYNVGQTSDFIKVPMINECLRQVLAWTPEAITDYCSKLLDPLKNFLLEQGMHFENSSFRAAHLLGFYLPEGINRSKLMDELKAEQIILSLRGDSIRVSPHVYNTPEDIDILIQTLRKNC